MKEYDSNTRSEAGLFELPNALCLCSGECNHRVRNNQRDHQFNPMPWGRKVELNVLTDDYPATSYKFPVRVILFERSLLFFVRYTTAGV